MKGKWALFAGLNGGFNTVCFQEIYEGSLDGAESRAYQLAIEDYESYEGLHGLRTTDQIIEDGDAEDEEEADAIYIEEREGWLEYYIEEFDETKDYN